jgi:hypothetical protein
MTPESGIGSRRRRALLATGAATAVLAIPEIVTDVRMRRRGGAGIVTLQFAGTPRAARRILRRWGREGRRAARASLLFDFPFLAAYGAFGWHGGHAVATALGDRGLPRLAALGTLTARASVVTATFDGVENLALLAVVGGRARRPYPAIARACALGKWGLVALGVPSLAFGAIAVRSRRRRFGDPAAQAAP